MSYSITRIEGIGAANAKKLAKARIKTTGTLLKHCCNKKGRKEISAQTGVGEKVLLKWVNMADLMRIKGVGEEYSELLEAAGVDTVKELKMRRPDNLTDSMTKANKKKKMVNRPPSEKTVNNWIAQAKKLKPTITH